MKYEYVYKCRNCEVVYVGQAVVGDMNPEEKAIPVHIDNKDLHNLHNCQAGIIGLGDFVRVMILK